MHNDNSQFILSAFRAAFDFMRPYLSNYEEFSRSLSKEVQVKPGDNIQYNFDLEIDTIIKDKLKEHGVSGKIYSEESGFFEHGPNQYRVVYDPFCNSSLASRTFQEAAIGITMFRYDYSFLASAIMDYQTGIVGITDGTKTNFFQIQSERLLSFDFKPCDKLEDAFTVITLENRKERESMKQTADIFRRAKRIVISSGHIYWLRLATGAVDAYLDPFGGEKLYEMFACTLAQKNGCIVSDRNGVSFDPSQYLKIFERDPNYIYYPVAARTQKLHEELLKSIRPGTS